NFIRYSCAHLLGYAIKTIWPCSKIGQNNIIKNGFYCDVDIFPRISEKDLHLLEELMHKIIKKSYNIFRKVVSVEDALKIFHEVSETYKISLVKSNINKQNKIGLYYHEKYIDIDMGMQVFN
ncbi:threonine--tRNA ligase, partial [Buchnera aphidicola]|nr:threonine--tRNA ligase [Buchnera aphidicola]